MRFSVHRLTRCVIRNGGETISLRLLDETGMPIELEIPASDADAIATTLPRMLRSSLQEKYRNEGSRDILPLECWRVEPTPDGSQIMVTLTADSGFEVCFSTEREACASLGSALSSNVGQCRTARA